MLLLRQGRKAYKNGTQAVHPSLMEQKIHPDLNSLAEELELSHGHSRHLYNQEFDTEHLENDTAVFEGLQPSTRSRRLQKEAYRGCMDNTGHISDQNSLEEAKNSHAEVYTSISQQDQKESHGQDVINDSPSQPSDIIQSGDESAGYTKASTIMRWSTFGRRPDSGERSTPESTSQSSLSQSQSFVTCLPYASSSSIQPQTPISQTRSGYISTPHSCSTVSNNPAIETDIPSPHTFGMPTPPQPSSKGSSYFTFKEVPPPLPPLNHPAFQEVSNTIRVASNMHKFPSHPGVDEHGVILDRYRRYTYSLPTLARPKSITTSRIGSPKSTAKKQTRPRAKSSSAGESTSTNKEDPTSFDPTPHPNKFKTHRKNQSKSSIASSRRSSAEYSAKQASSIGHEQMQDGCWEVQVSKEMVRLALGEGVQQRVETKPANLKTRRPSQGVPASTYGRARGENVGFSCTMSRYRPLTSATVPFILQWTGEASRLGSPFLLQDTLSDNLTDKQVSNDLIAKLRSISGRRVPSLAAEKYLRDDVMSNGDSKISPTGFSAKITRKEKEGTRSGGSSSSGSHSRRGGIRAKSTPSRTRTPSPQPARLDTGSRSGSIQGSSSLLVPPSLSVISATPEVSPVSPSRRTYHKSTPTMPTSSVLRTPSTPPVIEKSHSSGSASGKRKADEAGVSGDKTPPKEPREPRATFAPEPRTHRASGNSATSTHAPSSFNRSKRVRLSSVQDGKPGSRSGSRAGSTLPTPDDSPPNAKSTGSWSSKGSHGPMSASSHGYINRPPAPSASYASQSHTQRAPSRRSLSQASIPISALISPHAPSISHSGNFHMRDPRKPNPIQSTPWTLSFPSHVQEDESRWSRAGWVERGGSPLHAWLFFIGFIVFPLWWIAALFIPIPPTRRLGGTDAEKGVILDDPQVEHDTKSWRTRCRVMAIVSVFTYIPFIVLVAVFA
ncbi:hypothetical protein CVT25_013220 [Psilocybe cyanescens]|uniref:Serine-rich protein n=1 Tax=Psilocybe cyanescens TaxID=93625 RepID=A0A409X0N2_PSICY|nr:hypothetical protein CVT25_013220 [Psilocybe cyanescens]